MSRRTLLQSAIVFVMALMLGAIPASAQSASPEKLEVLKPPKGASVAIVVFEDMQCPDCKRAHPIVKDAAKATGVPVVHRDWPLPMHNWSTDAALLGRVFAQQSPELADAWRDYAFANQETMTPGNIRQRAAEFAKSKGTTLPFVLDPGGKLAAQVKADFALGQRIGLQHTPTIFVVTQGGTGAPFVEVVDRTQLVQMINDAKAQVAASKPASAPKGKPAKTSAKAAAKKTTQQ